MIRGFNLELAYNQPLEGLKIYLIIKMNYIKQEYWIIKSDIDFSNVMNFLIKKLINKNLIFINKTEEFPHKYCINYKLLTTSIPGKIIQIGLLNN